jgi:4-diphosphocytidyl-2-C-methyl-D-erythritol kinase
VEVTIPSFAKLNLDLRILNKRPDGFHEIRTVFQTISLKDTLSLDVRKTRRTEIVLESSVDIPDNLVVRAADAVLGHLKTNASVRFRLKKNIPMGAGMGGGSSNAAAVLIALPALLGKPIPTADLLTIAENLGSDVGFFLYGGTALGIGRGGELYPLMEQGETPVVIVATGIHVSTGQAYQNLNRSLTLGPGLPMLREFQTVAWALERLRPDQLPLRNDFEEGVYQQHPVLKKMARKLERLGARPARMTGSGSALFGVFSNSEEARAACGHFPRGVARTASFVSRRRYRQAWLRGLGKAGEASHFCQ